jgi:hypothetical protein
MAAIGIALLGMGFTAPVLRLLTRSRRNGLLAVYALVFLLVVIALTRTLVRSCMRCRRRRAALRAA